MKTGDLKKRQKLTHRKKAQAMVEFALVLPVLLLLVFGLLEFGRLLYAWIIIENATRFGMRYATTGQYNQVFCPVPATQTHCNPNVWLDAQKFPLSKMERAKSSSGCLMIR